MPIAAQSTQTTVYDAGVTLSKDTRNELQTHSHSTTGSNTALSFFLLAFAPDLIVIDTWACFHISAYRMLKDLR